MGELKQAVENKKCIYTGLRDLSPPSLPLVGPIICNQARILIKLDLNSICCLSAKKPEYKTLISMSPWTIRRHEPKEEKRNRFPDLNL